MLAGTHRRKRARGDDMRDDDESAATDARERGNASRARGGSVASTRGGDRRADERRVKSTCASASRALAVMDAEASDEAIEAAAAAALETLFDPSLRRARRVVQASVNSWSERHASVCARAFAVRVNAEMEAAARCERSSEALGRLGSAASAHGTAPRGAFERGAIEAIDRNGVLRALARGLELLAVEMRGGGRCAPAEAEAVVESVALAYELLGDAGDVRRDGSKVDEARVLRALIEFLTLVNAPSRDATVTAGMTVARACVGDRNAVDVVEETLFPTDGARVCDKSRLLQRVGVSSNDEMLSEAPCTPFGVLALARGFVAVARPDALAERRGGEFLFDRLLPQTCDWIEDGDDVHFRFHAVMCLRATLKSLHEATDLRIVKEFPTGSFNRVAHVISSYWEDKLAQTVREIQVCFGSLLDILLCLSKSDEYVNLVVEQTLRRPTEQKSRYLVLSALVERVGARRILRAEPRLLSVTLAAMRDVSIASAASHALKELSAKHLEELGSVEEWRLWWLEPVKIAMLTASNVRTSIATYVLPVLFKQDRESIVHLTKHVVEGEKNEDVDISAAAISILKVARNLLMVDQERITVIKPASDGPTYTVDQSVVDQAMASADKAARLDALEWLCLGGRKGAVTLPGAYERTLIKRLISANLKGETVSFRGTVASLAAKLFARIWTAVNNVGQKVRRRGEAALKKGIETPAGARDPLRGDIDRAMENHAFVGEMIDTLVSNMYPGAPFERRCTALELLNTIMTTWEPYEHALDAAHESLVEDHDVNVARRMLTSPYAQYANHEAFTNLLFSALVDSWEQLRVKAFELLSRHDAPFAGMEMPENVRARLVWALELLRSPRVRESGAAALLIRLLIRKYGFDSQWRMQFSPDVRVSRVEGEPSSSAEKQVEVLTSLCDLLENDIDLAGKDLVEACRRSLAHGPLFLLRCVLQEIDLDGCVRSSSRARLQATMNRMMSLVHRATEMSLEYISQPDALGASAEEVKLQSTDFAMMDDDFDGDDDGSSELAPMAQIITSACWLTVKEGSLLTGDAMDSSATTKIFSPDEITDAGARLMRVLFSVKHTGALAKTRIAMTALCSRLLRSGDDALTSLPQRWLDEVAERLNRPGQDFRDRVRRSAGLPYAFIAILLAEPKNQPRTALADALPRLLDVASGRTSSSDIARVHAFNVIRVVFADRDLAHDTTPYAARGVEICIDAFSAPTWEIKNAATLAYASLLTKVCGYMNAPRRAREYASDGTSREVRVIDFFQRFPTLIAYLRDELEKATAASTSATDGAFGVHPSLYPVLALFSRLRPSPAKDRTEYTDGKSGTECIAPIVRCLYGNYLAVRTAAARCLVAVVPSSRVLEYADDILAFTSLDEHARERPSTNAAHGAMLFLLEILTEVRSGTYGEDVCLSEFAAAAAARLVSRAAYGVDARVPLVSAAWLRCAETALAVANIASSRCTHGARCDRDDPVFKELANMTWQCSAPVLAARVSGPGSCEWHKAAAGARTRLAMGYDAWGEPLIDAVRAMFDVGDVVVALSDAFAADADYEYRAETYKAMFKTPSGGDVRAFGDVQRLRKCVTDALIVETRHTCVRRALRCLELLSRGDEDKDEDEDDARLWTAAHDATFSSRNERVRAEGLRAIATLCRRRLAKNARGIIESGDADAFIFALRDGAAADKSDETRSAAADALRRSEILAQVSSSTCTTERSIELALTAWTCALTLIEDADADVRAVASRAASLAVASRRSSTSSSPSGTHEEETLCDVFAYVCAEFGAFDAFRSYIIGLARGPSRDDDAFAANESSNARRLFDREADNPYAEELLLTQLAAKHIVETFDARDDVARALETTLDALDVATRRAERREDNRFIPVARASIGAWCFHDVLARSGDDRMTKRYEETMEAVRRATPCLRTGETKEERLFLLGHRV